MSKKIGLLTLLFIFILSLTACGANEAGSSVADTGSNSYSTNTTSVSTPDDEFALSDSELKEIFEYACMSIQKYVDANSFELSYEYIDPNCFKITGISSYEDPDSVEGFGSSEFVLTVEASNGNYGWEFSSLLNFEAYYDYGIKPYVVKEFYDTVTFSSFLAVFDRETQTVLSDYYAAIFLPDSEGAMCTLSFEGSYGFINSDGSLIAPAVFDEVYDYAFIAERDAAFVRFKDSWGAINHAGQYVINPSYSSLAPCGDYISATTSQSTLSSPIIRCSLINWNGDILIPEELGEEYLYYEPGYYVCANDKRTGKLYDSDLSLHDFTDVCAAIGMTFVPEHSYAPSVHCSIYGWNQLHTGGQYEYLLNKDMELISPFRFVILSSLSNENYVIGRTSDIHGYNEDVMLDHDGNIIMTMPQERVGLALYYKYNGKITDYYALGDYTEGNSPKPFFCVLDTQELIVCESIDHINNTECLVVKPLNSSLYCVYDKGVKVKEAFYTDYSYDYDTGAITLKASESTSETYIPEK